MPTRPTTCAPLVTPALCLFLSFSLSLYPSLPLLPSLTLSRPLSPSLRLPLLSSPLLPSFPQRPSNSIAIEDIRQKHGSCICCGCSLQLMKTTWKSISQCSSLKLIKLIIPMYKRYFIYATLHYEHVCFTL